MVGLGAILAMVILSVIVILGTPNVKAGTASLAEVSMVEREVREYVTHRCVRRKGFTSISQVPIPLRNRIINGENIVLLAIEQLRSRDIVDLSDSSVRKEIYRAALEGCISSSNG